MGQTKKQKQTNKQQQQQQQQKTWIKQYNCNKAGHNFF